MTTRTDTALTLTRVIRAAPERVFQAWTRPDELKRWSCPEGLSVADTAVDLRVGGSYRIRMRDPEGALHTAVGTYREIDPPRRLVYTWEWVEETHKVGETLVTVEFKDLGGSTEVILTHERFPAAEATQAHEDGWISCLDRLEQVFAGGAS
jgi:uncharacterized protein YndB with AHSA1/START domain